MPVQDKVEVDLTHDRLLQIQEMLAELGFDPGAVDGSLGPQTRMAIIAFQRSIGTESTGRMTNEDEISLAKAFADHRSMRAADDGDSESNTTSSVGIDSLGLAVAPLTDDLRSRFKISAGVRGVTIVEVREGLSASEEKLRPGDVIIEVGNQEVYSVPEATSKIKQVHQDGKKSVLLLINRQDDRRFVALRFPKAQ